MKMEMEKILQQATGKVDSAELFRIKSKTIPVNFEVNRLKSIDIAESEGQALRIINQGRIGFASLSGSSLESEEDTETMVEQALATSEFGATAAFDFPEKIEVGPTTNSSLPEKVKIFDPKIVEKSIEEMVKIGEEILVKIKDFDRRLRSDVTIVKDISEIEYSNSRGGSFSYAKTAIAYSLMIQQVEDQDILMIESSQAAAQDKLEVEELVSEAIENFKWGEKVASLESGKMPVIFTPKAVLTLILPLIIGLNGKMVWEKVSPLAEQQNKKLWSEQLSLYSEGLIDFALGSAPFDDEGVEMRRYPLVEEGEIKNFYYDLQTAGLAGVESTGNGLREGISSPPGPGITNLVMKVGTIPFPEMVKDIKEGIIIDQVLGLGQGNIISGAFSNNVQLGFKVENGKIVGRVKDVMIAGNALEELKNIIALGDRSEWVGGRFKFPHLYLKSLSVSTKV